jgi:hypothetical protein
MGVTPPLPLHAVLRSALLLRIFVNPALATIISALGNDAEIPRE